MTFSAFGSISPVIMGCLFSTIAAVSLQTGLMLLRLIEEKARAFLYGCLFPGEAY